MLYDPSRSFRPVVEQGGVLVLYIAVRNLVLLMFCRFPPQQSNGMADRPETRRGVPARFITLNPASEQNMRATGKRRPCLFVSNKPNKFRLWIDLAAGL